MFCYLFCFASSFFLQHQHEGCRHGCFAFVLLSLFACFAFERFALPYCSNNFTPVEHAAGSSLAPRRLLALRL
jgi:hypothetical protein